MNDAPAGGLELAPEGARCAIHNETAATVVCSRCGSYCCPECGVQVGERYLCRACFQLEGVSLMYGEASKLQRFINMLIDSMINRVLAAIIAVPVAEVTGSAGLALVLYAVVTLGYHIVFESMLGQTPGKLVTRTKVVTTTGGRASWRRIIGRTLLRYVPFEPLSFFFADHGWHDAWSGTRVVRATPPAWMRAA